MNIHNLRRFIIDLNLFESGEEEVIIIREERWTTRLYLVLLSLALIILVLYTAVTKQTFTITVKDPSYNQFNQLELKYSSTLRCPCSNINIKYRTFVVMQPTYHQICSSSFITDEWIIASYGAAIATVRPMDVRTVISAYSQMIRFMCQLSQTSFTESLDFFLDSSLITAYALSTTLLELQVNIQIDVTKSSGPWSLTSTLNAMRFTLVSNQVLDGFGNNILAYDLDSNRSRLASLAVIGYDMSTNISDNICYCLPGSTCLMPGAIYSTNSMSTFGIYQVFDDRISIQGMKVGCYPLEGLLASSLECFYELSCIQLFVSNASNLVPLSSSQLSQYPLNTTMETFFNNLMVEQWLTSISPSQYYAQCAPLICTYSVTERNSLLIVITTIIALIGGLNTVLRIVTPYIVRLIMIFIQKLSRTRGDTQQVIPTAWDENITRFDRVKNKISFVWTKIKMFNLFDTQSSNPSKETDERRTTRLYIILLLFFFIILFFYATFKEQTNTYTIKHPSQSLYEKFQRKYPDTIQCPCTKVAIPLSKIVSISWKYHQICSTQFVSPLFYRQLASINITIPLYRADFMHMSASFFQYVFSFCALSYVVLTEEYREFGTTLFVNVKLLSPNSFQTQIDQIIQSFIRSLSQVFGEALEKILAFTASNQLLSVSYVSYNISIIDNTVHLMPDDFLGCSCLLQARTCSMPAAFYEFNENNDSFTQVALVTGVKLACLPIESLLQSSLICWYTSACYEMVIQFWKSRTIDLSDFPRILNSTLPSKYNSSTLLSTIINELMIEEWFNESYYEIFFDECNPDYCTYTVTERSNIIAVLIIFIGLFGGLNIVFRLITPMIIRSMKCSSRMNLLNYLHNIPSRLIDLNLFYNRNKSSILTQRRERQSTYLYIILLISGLITVLFYNILAQFLETITIDKPTEVVYDQLIQSYGESNVKCYCSKIAINYGSFLSINTLLHQVCTSTFLQDPWLASLIDHHGDWSNWTNTNDFHIHGISIFTGLRTLCAFAQAIVDKAIRTSLATYMFSSQVLPSKQFLSKVESDLAQLKNYQTSSMVIPFTLDTIQTSQILNVYSLSWMYTLNASINNHLIPIQPVRHGNCSCATSSNCFEPMILNNEPIPHFLLGCLPMKSLVQSTLICLYNETCLNRINLERLSVIPLNASVISRFSINATVYELAMNVFIEQWIVNISYSRFFTECQPSTCQYSRMKRNDAVYIITAFLGIYGGLSATLRFFVPHIIAIVNRIIQRIHGNVIQIQTQA